MNSALPAHWARCLVAALIRHGARRFFISPGARSAPLALAIAEARDQGLTAVEFHYDERGLGFAALGAAQATGQPTVCLTTSGSAVAQLLPATIEAFYSGHPLILLTADRPPELRQTGANQTILQPGIFGPHVLAAADLPPPAEGNLDQIDPWLDNFLEPLHRPWPGPVHLNVPFREPLLPANGTAVPAKSLASFSDGSRDIQVAEEPPEKIFDWLRGARRGLVLVGEMSCAEQEIWPGILQAAGHLGWPVAADALSGGKGLPGVIQHLDFLLQAGAVPHPESILHLGGRLVQRRANELLANTPGAGVCQIRRGPSRLAPPGQNPQVWLGDPGFFCREVILQVPSAWSDEWRESWEEKDRLVEGVLAGVLDGELERGNLSEPGLARWAAEVAVQQDAVLFPGNSMPVRDFDAMVGPLARRVQVTGQRGASGIDGNIAHVAGYARASGRRVLALLGDLAVLHDLNSLSLLRGLPVTLVVPNNHGGGIFRFLPLDMPATTREEFLETPHSMEFGDICRQFGLAYVRTNSASVAGASLANQHGPLLIEVPSDRARNRLKHEQLARSVTDALPAC